MDLSYLGANIKKARKKLKLTQAQVCEIVDLSVTYYSNIERGVKIPRLETFVKIAQTLNTTPTLLLMETFQHKDELKNVYLSDDFEALTEEEKRLISESINMLAKQLKLLRDTLKTQENT